MAAQTKDILAEIERQSATASRSPLSRWMRQNHDALLSRIGERPDWRVLAGVFERSGLTDRSGKPASPETARKAWERVRKAVATARAKRPAKQPLVQPAPEPASTLRLPDGGKDAVSQPAAQGSRNPTDDAPKFGFSKLRHSNPKE